MHGTVSIIGQRSQRAKNQLSAGTWCHFVLRREKKTARHRYYKALSADEYAQFCRIGLSCMISFFSMKIEWKFVQAIAFRYSDADA